MTANPEWISEWKLTRKVIKDIESGKISINTHTHDLLSRFVSGYLNTISADSFHLDVKKLGNWELQEVAFNLYNYHLFSTATQSFFNKNEPHNYNQLIDYLTSRRCSSLINNALWQLNPYIIKSYIILLINSILYSKSENRLIPQDEHLTKANQLLVHCIEGLANALIIQSCKIDHSHKLVTPYWYTVLAITNYILAFCSIKCSAQPQTTQARYFIEAAEYYNEKTKIASPSLQNKLESMGDAYRGLFVHSNDELQSLINNFSIEIS